MTDTSSDDNHQRMLNERSLTTQFLLNRAFPDRLPILAARLAQAAAANQELHLDAISDILAQHDYRLVADYTRFDDSEKAHWHSMPDIRSQRQFADRLRCQMHRDGRNSRIPVKQVETSDQLLQDVGGCSSVFLTSTGGPIVSELLDLSGGDLCALKRGLLDLPGKYRLVRRDLVKSLCLRDGTNAVLKFQNPAKQNRFANELNVIERFAELGLNGRAFVRTCDGARPVHIRTLEYFTFTNCNGMLMVASRREDAITLEDFFLENKDPSTRLMVLRDLSVILDWLYARGIVWGDMAPRNILLSDIETASYVLLDFEKTVCGTAPVSDVDRYQHVRGYMCTEEFGAVCTVQEVVTCFRKYFRPDEWTSASHAIPDLIKRKPEYIDILSEQIGSDYSQRDYDALELRVFDLRVPYVEGERRVTPTYNGYRIDHYFGGDIEPKLTAILLSLEPGSLSRALNNVVDEMLNRVDEDLYLTEFLGILQPNGARSDPKRSPAALYLVDMINRMFALRGDVEAQAREIGRFA